jgi:hypothetical protein
MVAVVLLTLSSRLQLGEHYLHYSHGGRESIHSEEFFSIREIVHRGRPGTLYRPDTPGLHLCDYFVSFSEPSP